MGLLCLRIAVCIQYRFNYIRKKPFSEHRFTNGFPNEKSPEITLISGDKFLSVKRSFFGYLTLINKSKNIKYLSAFINILKRQQRNLALFCKLPESISKSAFGENEVVITAALAKY